MDDARRLEHDCADAWPAVIENTIGDWRLRAADGFTGRANSVLAVGSAGVPVAEALAEAHVFAETHGIAPLAQAIEGSAEDAALADHGWEPFTRHPNGHRVTVLTAPIATATATATATQPADTVRMLTEPTSGWWELTVDTDRPTAAQWHVLTAVPILGPLVAEAEGRTVGAVRGVVVGGSLYIARLAVRPEHRRRGTARALMAAAQAWGAGRGATRCVLQVAIGNEGALALYRALGFTEHHRYRYRVPASTDAGSWKDRRP